MNGRLKFLVSSLLGSLTLLLAAFGDVSNTEYRGRHFNIEGIKLMAVLNETKVGKSLSIQEKLSEAQCDWISSRRDLTVTTSYGRAVAISGTKLFFGKRLIGKLGDSPQEIEKELRPLTDLCLASPEIVMASCKRFGNVEPWSWGFLIRVEFDHEQARRFTLQVGDQLSEKAR